MQADERFAPTEIALLHDAQRDYNEMLAGTLKAVSRKLHRIRQSVSVRAMQADATHAISLIERSLLPEVKKNDHAR